MKSLLNLNLMQIQEAVNTLPSLDSKIALKILNCIKNKDPNTIFSIIEKEKILIDYYDLYSKYNKNSLVDLEEAFRNDIENKSVVEILFLLYFIRSFKYKNAFDLEHYFKIRVNNTTYNTNIDNEDSISFGQCLKNFLKGYDTNNKHKNKRRYEVLIENLYGFASSGSKEAIRAIITMVERIEGRPGISNNNNNDEKEDTIANEIHALTQAIKSKELKEDKDEC